MEFCVLLTLALDLTDFVDPLNYLQIFAEWVRLGVLAAGGTAAQKCTTEGYLRNVAQIFFGVGVAEPRLDHLSRIGFRLVRQLCAYYRMYTPPTCAHPIHVALLHECHFALHDGND